MREIATRWIRLWQGGDLGEFDALHSPDFVDHSSAGRPSDRAGFRQGIVALCQAFPDFYGRIEDLVVDETAGKVAIRWSARGTHRGAYMGRAATGRQVVFRGIEIIRIVNGRIVQRWGEWDGEDILRQLT